MLTVTPDSARMHNKTKSLIMSDVQSCFLRVFFAINFSGMAVGFATAYFPEYMKARFSAGLIFKMLDFQPKIDSDSAAGLRTVFTILFLTKTLEAF